MAKALLKMLALGWFSGATLCGEKLPLVEGVEVQPLVAHAMRLGEALSFMGNILAPQDVKRLQALKDALPSADTGLAIQGLLDPYCLALVEINPETRVKVLRGPAGAELVQGGWRSFLVKVNNQAGITSRLEVESPNAASLFQVSRGASRVQIQDFISDGELTHRFLDLTLYRRRPLFDHLSGLRLEYVILQIYTRAVGKREARIEFHVGEGTQDLGFRNSLDILFRCEPSVKVVFRVQDHDGLPTMASFVIRDRIERLGEDPNQQALPNDVLPLLKRSLGAIYPLPSRRLARDDEFPDFFFHPQIYRQDGEHVHIPPGNYEVTFTRGPEYLTETRSITVPRNVKSHEVSFQLRRWAHLAKLGWYSADHHVHAAGCSHYENPEQGVNPEHIWRQIQGEDLNIASILTWGPGWYHQKQFFEGRAHALSTARNLMRYDVEVSGFPSSHAGHLCLLGLKEDDYPGTSSIEEWPSWTLPILRWARSQGGVAGYAHSGWGLEPIQPTQELPNYEKAKFDSVGANEYIVTVAHDAVDFLAVGDTPPLWELNIWYHTLNCGFRTRIIGESDFPCIYDERVGMGRSYTRLEGGLNYDQYLEEIRKGRSYVSDGRSHIIDFFVNEHELGTDNSEVLLDRPEKISVTARVCAYLPQQVESFTLPRLPVWLALGLQKKELSPGWENLRNWFSGTKLPYWHIERARIGQSRMVPVELLVNGEAVARSEIIADGNWNDLAFDWFVTRSSWLALRILPSSHTNPIFVLLGDQPVRASVESARWCRAAVDQCWKMKRGKIRENDLDAAAAAYDKARETYDLILSEATKTSFGSADLKKSGARSLKDSKNTVQ